MTSKEPSLPNAETQDALHPGLKIFLFVSAMAVILSFLDATLAWHNHVTTGFKYLYLEAPLFDLYCYQSLLPRLHTPAFFLPNGFPWTYPAPCLWIYQFLYLGKTRDGIWLLYLNSVILLVASAATMVGRRLSQAGLTKTRSTVLVIIVILLSWPIYFSVERGNIESFLWLALALSLTFYAQGRYNLAAAGIGLVAAFKIYPILFLALFLERRKWRYLALGLLSVAFGSYAGLRSIGPDVRTNAAFIRAGIRLFLSRYSATFDPIAIGFDHSAWSILKLKFTRINHANQRGLEIYTFTAAIVAITIFVSRIRLSPRKNQVLALCIFTVLLPSTSFDYTLQALYIPFSWIVIDSVRLQRENRDQRGLTPMMLCFSLLLAPLTFVHGRGIYHGGQIKAATLICLLILTLRYPMQEPLPVPVR